MNIKHLRGLISEYVAMFYYRCCFYSVIKHRERNYGGEVDFICQKLNNIVFVEVKARTSNFNQFICGYNQQQRIKKAAQIFLLQYPKYQGFNIRFDLVIIPSYFIPKVIRNAW